MAKPMCQSCGQPLKDDNRGTEKDGLPATEYCNLCYMNGVYVDPDITLEEMQAKCIEAMKKMHFPAFMAKHIAKNQVPKLKRWQT